MVQAYSPDLRSRVIRAATSGMSARQAAERFGVGVDGHRLGEALSAVARPQGKPLGSRLDAHADFILGLAAAGAKDISLAEIAERLASERGVNVDFSPIEQAFSKLKALLRKAAARTIPDLWAAIAEAIPRCSPRECENYFKAARYEPM